MQMQIYTLSEIRDFDDIDKPYVIHTWPSRATTGPGETQCRPGPLPITICAPCIYADKFKLALLSAHVQGAYNIRAYYMYLKGQ